MKHVLRIAITLLFFSHIILSASPLSPSESKLIEKMNLPFPEWKMEAIASDLEYFQDKECTIEKIRENYRELTTKFPKVLFALYTIQDNQLSLEYTPKLRGHPRIHQFKLFFWDFFRYFNVPDMEFIVCHGDDYDNPEVLENTHVPVWVFSKKKSNPKAVLFPILGLYYYGLKNRLTQIDQACSSSMWESKNSIAFWRGNRTGPQRGENARKILVKVAQNSDLIDAVFAVNSASSSSDSPKKRWTQPKDQIVNKYLIAVEGNSFPSSLCWQLQSNCCLLFGDSEYIEYYYRSLVPYKHYVPFKRDCSDLEETILWLIENDAVAHSIAKEGAQFAREHLTLEDIYIYFYHLLLEYNTLVSSTNSRT